MNKSRDVTLPNVISNDLKQFFFNSNSRRYLNAKNGVNLQIVNLQYYLSIKSERYLMKLHSGVLTVSSNLSLVKHLFINVSFNPN